MTQVGGIASGHLRSFVERVERLHEERASLAADIREVYAEAKGMGFDVPTIKWCISERNKEESDRSERDHLRDLYWRAVQGGTEVATRVPVRETNSPASHGGTDGAAPSVSARAAVRAPSTEQNAPGASNRDVSTGNEPSPEAGPQAEASPCQATGCGMPADCEAHTPQGGGNADEAVAGNRASSPPSTDSVPGPLCPTPSTGPEGGADPDSTATSGEAASPSAASPSSISNIQRQVEAANASLPEMPASLRRAAE